MSPAVLMPGRPPAIQKNKTSSLDQDNIELRERTHSEPMIEVAGVSKVYLAASGRRIEAVNNITFSVAPGEIFGLLGPNGAGKSTTIGMLTTMVKITSGRASIAGVDVAADPITVKQVIAAVPQLTNLDRSLTARENLLFHAKYFGIGKAERETRADELLDLMALTARAEDFPADFSGGMARRLMIARALMHEPSVIFLDEATAGLDPQSRLMLWRKIRELNKAGRTICLTTHYMEEADQLCDRVAVIDHGKILALDTPANLKAKIPGGNIVELRMARDDHHLAGLLREELADLENVEIDEKTVRLFLNNPEEGLVRAVDVARAHQVELESVRLQPITLEDVFVDLTGRGLRE